MPSIRPAEPQRCIYELKMPTAFCLELCLHLHVHDDSGLVRAAAKLAGLNVRLGDTAEKLDDAVQAATEGEPNAQ